MWLGLVIRVDFGVHVKGNIRSKGGYLHGVIDKQVHVSGVHLWGVSIWWTLS